MYNASLPYSVFAEIPITVDDTTTESARHHTRVMTAPNSLFYGNSSPLSTEYNVSSPVSSIMTPIRSTFPLDNDYCYLQTFPSYIDTSFIGDEVPPLTSDMQPTPVTSIYDVFTSDEIQQYTPQDYFSQHKLSMLQQQLQIHTKNAYDIVLHSDTMSNMYASSHQIQGKKRSRTTDGNSTNKKCRRVI